MKHRSWQYRRQFHISGTNRGFKPAENPGLVTIMICNGGWVSLRAVAFLPLLIRYGRGGLFDEIPPGKGLLVLEIYPPPILMKINDPACRLASIRIGCVINYGFKNVRGRFENLFVPSFFGRVMRVFFFCFIARKNHATYQSEPAEPFIIRSFYLPPMTDILKRSAAQQQPPMLRSHFYLYALRPGLFFS